MARFFRKTYTNCTPGLYVPVRRSFIKLKRLGCPDLILISITEKQNAREDGFSLNDRKFSDVQLCFDTLNTCYNWCFLLHTDLMMNGSYHCKDTYRAIAAICSNITTNMFAIRLLSSKRYFAQARALARSLREFGDLFVTCCDSAEFSANFVKHQLDEEASYFWKKWVSQGKLKKRVLRTLRDTVGIDEAALNDYRNSVSQEEAAFSSAVHGSYSTAIMSIMGDLIAESMETQDYHPDQPSQRILGASVFAGALPILASSVLLSQKTGYFNVRQDSERRRLVDRAGEINDVFRELAVYSLFGMYADQGFELKQIQVSHDGK